MFQGSEYAMDYEYVWVLQQATLVFEMELFHDLITIPLGICSFEQVVIISRNFVS